MPHRVLVSNEEADTENTSGSACASWVQLGARQVTAGLMTWLISTGVEFLLSSYL